MSQPPPSQPQDGPGPAGVSKAGPQQSELGEPESSSEPEPSPANNSDLAVALRQLPGFTRLLTRAGPPAPGGSRGWRRDDEPNAGASQALDCDANGIEITISGSGFQRHDRLTWPQVASWIDAGVTPARFGIIVTADRLSTFCRTRRDELIAAGKCDPDAAVRELDKIRDDTIRLVVDAALRTRGAAAPVPAAHPGNPAYYTAAMITRPDEAASREENTVLERLNRLRTDIREPQPITPGEMRATIRRWIGDDLPDYARALGMPEKMRAWISRQVSGPAGRPSRVTYETPGVPGRRWYGASPEGLLTAIGNDDRAETLIPWEEIPAWVQPGITSSLLDRLTAADDARRALFSRRLTAAVHTRASLQGPTDEEEEQAARRLREVIADVWAAIEAEDPPSPAQLEGVRRAYRDTGPAQETLFDEPPQETGRNSAAGQASAPGLVPASAGPRHGTAAESVPPPEPVGPLSVGDVLLGLGRLPAFVISDLFSAIDTGQPLGSVFRQLAPYSGEREAGEPDAGARETVTAESTGLRIHVTTRQGSRTGLVAWPEIADLLQPELTPSRRQILMQAAATGLRFAAANASFRAVGEGSLAAAAEEELRILARAALTAILDDARSASSGQPPQPAGNDTAAVKRISQLAAALPGRRPQPRTPVSQVRAGDIIGHPGYRFQPFRVAAPPRHHDAEVEITGHLAAPSDGEPADQITFTLPATRHPDPVVSLIPLPQRSLRPIVPAPGTEGGVGHGQDIRRGTADPQVGRGQPPPELSRSTARTADPVGPAAATVEDTAPAAPASGGHENPGPPPGDMTPTEENTMPPAPAETPHAPQATSDVPGGTPKAAPPRPAAASEPVGRPSADNGTRQTLTAAHPGDGTDLVDELDRVLNAIIERRRGVGRQSDAAHDDFTDIRAAFTLLRNALDIGGPTGLVMGYSPSPSAAAPGPTGPGRTAPEPARSQDPGPSGFDDIRSAFADLRRVLDLPAGGRHARGSAPPPDPTVGRLLDQAVEEAQACARWYRDTPEWQRITTIGRAVRELVGAIREAARDYWAEIRQDIRVRGFGRTLAARVCLAVSGTAHVLAARLERAGRGNTRIRRAAWGLHQATATFADRIMRYAPPQNPDRMNDARRIIDDLGARQRGSQAPTHTADGARPEPANAPDPVRLARASFIARAADPSAAPLAEPNRRAAPQAGQCHHAAHRA
jgi:hypothetical protein